MKPILYEQTETEFTNQGIGVLADALKCVVTEELNNVFDLEMTYPVTGVLFKSLTLRRIIKAKPNQTDDPQPFRIYKITKPMNGSVTVLAHHISYDLSGKVVPPFTVQTSAAVIGTITATALATIQPFSFNNAIIKNGVFRSDRPTSARSILGSFIETYGGELHYNVKQIGIVAKRGSDNGAVIAYGKNLMDLKQEANCADMYTLVYPYYLKDDTLVMLSEKTIRVPGRFDHDRVLPLDLTESFPDSVPTQAQLRTAANKYIADENIGYPKVNLTINYLSIEDSEEAAPLHMYDGIALGDDVTVRFEKLDINTKSRCVRYVYDAVTERVESITIGDKAITFIDTTAKQYAAVEKGEYQALIQDAISAATNLITNGLGGYVMIHKSSPELTAPDEILILGDSPDLNEAKQVWRWNKGALGYSQNGYKGPYSTAMTADGKIVADMITTGVLRAIEISNGNGTFHVTSDGVMTATAGTIGGYNIASNAIYNDTIKLSNNGLFIINYGNEVGSFRKLANDTVGLVLSTNGYKIGWYIQKSNGTYETILEYYRDTDYLYINKDLHMHNKKIYNVGELSISSGSTETYITHSEISVEPYYPGVDDYGYLTIKTYRSYFNAYGLYKRTVQVSSNTYKTLHMSIVSP